MTMTPRRTHQTGSAMVSLLGMIIIFAILTVTVGSTIVDNVRVTKRTQSSEQAFNIAEAGLNYYLWHLNHNANDYRDGNTTPVTPGDFGYGPYAHDYHDIQGRRLGTYMLYIKPGAVGSTTVTVRSIGKVDGVAPATRTLEAKIGAPSFSAYAVAGNTALWFGNTESTQGPIHSNIGIKMDGANTDQVTSSSTSYTVPWWSGSGANTVKPGVWCNTAVLAPVNCATRSKTSWSYPVPAVDFNKISGDLCGLKKLATGDTSATACTTVKPRSAGYIPPVNTAYSATAGYLVTLNNDNTYNLERVTSERDTKPEYSSALTRSNIATRIPVPANGVIFVEDNVWVRTQTTQGYDGRVTIASARLAVAGETKAVLADDILYSKKYDGGDAIGIIAEGDVELAPYLGAPGEVNAALIAQNGSVGIRQKYLTNGNYVAGYPLESQKLRFHGSVASNQEWTWSVVLCGTSNSASCWAGYRYTQTSYDENLRYAPPPSFPTTSTFDLLSWREVVHKP